MSYILIGDRVEAVFYHRSGSQNGLIVRHYICTARDGAGGTHQQFADVLSTAWAGLIKDWLTSQAAYLGTSAQTIAPIRTDRTYSDVYAGFGLGDDAQIPAQVAGLISLRTGLAGRQYRGRAYVPFPERPLNGPDNNPTDAALLKMANMRNFFLQNQVAGTAGVDASFMSPILYSRRFDLSTPLESGLVRRQWATQRRRGYINRGDAPPVP